MSRDAGVPIVWPPGTPWLIVALAGMFFVVQGPTPASQPPTQEAVQAVGETAAAAPEIPASAASRAWSEDAWGAVELLRRFLGEVPAREKKAREDVRGLLKVEPAWQADDLKVRADAFKAFEQGVRSKEGRELAQGVETIRQEVLARADLRILVATVTDYQDSNGRWTADEAFDAIQAAAGAASYSLFDFYLPDWRPAATGGETQKSLSHEREPAALLFKRWTPMSRPKLLLVLLVPETPTSGLHGAVFRTALRFARDFASPGGGPVEIVGPSFSGSTLSMRMGLEDVACDRVGGGLDVRIVSGTATSSANRAALTTSLPHPSMGPPALSVSFNTTVHQDEDLLRVLADQLTRVNPAWRTGKKVALLVESNTGWLAGWVSEKSRQRDQDLGTMVMPHATHLAFPLHISRLVSLSEKDRGRGSAQATPQWATQLLPHQPLRLEDTVTPTDAFPRFTPGTTAPAVMATLGNTLEAIARDEFGAVGILATDKRDHLFLAREINRVAPNVLMFGTEPHALMLHPEYQPYLRGTLMASSYPIHAHSQRLTSAVGEFGRVQFASMGTQGMYNALLLVLGQEEALLDYAHPWVVGDTRPLLRPAPWVVLVGREEFLPVAVGTQEPLDGYTLARPKEHPGPVKRPQNYLLPSWQARTVWAVPLVLLLAHLVILAIAQSRPVRGFRVFSPPRLFGHGSTATAAAQHLEHAMLVLACALALLMALAWQLRMWQILASDSPVLGAGMFPDRAGDAFAGTLFLAAFTGAALLLVSAWRGGQSWRRGSSPLPEVTSMCAVTLAVAVSATLGWYLVDPALWTGSSGVFHVERTLGVGSLTSPLPAIAAFVGIAYAWSFWSLRSLHHHVVDTERAAPLLQLLTGLDGRHAATLARGARSTIHPAGGLLLFPVVATAAALLLGTSRTHAVDGRALGWVLVTGSAFGLLAVGIELAQAAWLGRRVKDALEYLRGHALAPAIETLGAEPADWGISLEPRHGSNRRLLERKLGGLRGQLDSLRRDLETAAFQIPSPPTPDRRAGGKAAPAPPVPWQAALAHRAGIRTDDLHALSNTLPPAGAPAVVPGVRGPVPEHERPLLRTDLWGTAVAVTALLVPPMDRRFWRSRRPVPTTTVPERFLRDAERFVALALAIIVRTLVVRVVRGLSIAALLGGTLLAGHLLYTFPGRRFWFVLDFCALALVATVSVRLLISLERDHVLSRLWSSTPGRVGITSGLLWRAVATASLPLITLLAVKFPEVGGSLLAWIEPVRQMMPMP